MITAACEGFISYGKIPGKNGLALGRASLQKNGLRAWGQALTGRALLIAQSIVSIIAAVLSFAALIIFPLLALGCFEGKEPAKNICKVLAKNTGWHIAAILLSLIAAAIPFSLFQEPKS